MKKLMLGLMIAFAATAGAVVVLALGGCAYLNGDAMWLSDEQKEVVISGCLPTLFETEYSFKESNLPFSFKVLRNREFAHIGHSFGSPDLSKGGYIDENSVLRFSIKEEGMPDAAEFLVSNGVLKVVKACKRFVNAERRTGPLSFSAEQRQSCVFDYSGNQEPSMVPSGKFVSLSNTRIRILRRRIRLKSIHQVTCLFGGR